MNPFTLFLWILAIGIVLAFIMKIIQIIKAFIQRRKNPDEPLDKEM